MLPDLGTHPALGLLRTSEQEGWGFIRETEESSQRFTSRCSDVGRGELSAPPPNLDLSWSGFVLVCNGGFPDARLIPYGPLSVGGGSSV